MTLHPALISAHMAERERELVRRAEQARRLGRTRREHRRRRRLRDLLRRPRPAPVQTPLRTSAPWRP